MNIQLISDTHTHLDRFRVHPQADVVIHAGDFVYDDTDDTDACVMAFVECCRLADKPYALVLGNHDYYGKPIGLDYPKHLERLGVNVLYRGRAWEYDGMTFVGDTLWTDFDAFGEPSLADLGAMYRGVRDFSCILAKGGLDFHHLSDEHRQTLDFLEKYRHRPDVFVVTHFAPHRVMVHDKFKDSPFNAYYVNDVDLTGFYHWACGHLHYTDRRQADGCQLYINASGYQQGGRVECPDFNPAFLISL